MDRAALGCLFLAVFAGVCVDGTSPPITECEYMLYAIQTFRDDFVNNEIIAGISGDEWHVHHYTSYFKNTTGVSLDDDKGLKQLACHITDAENLEELAEVTGLGTGDLRQLKYLDETERTYNGVLREVKKVKRFMRKSGFPDTWPVTAVTKAETLKLLQDCHDIGPYLISLGYPVDEETIASALTNPQTRSLEEYLAELGNVEESAVEAFRKLLTKKGLKSFNRYLNMFLVLVDAIRYAGIDKLE